MHGVHSVYNSMEDGLQKLFKVNDPVFHIVSCTEDYTADHLKLCPRQGLIFIDNYSTTNLNGRKATR